MIELAYAAEKVQKKIGRCVPVEIFMEKYKTDRRKEDLIHMLRLVRTNVVQHETSTEAEALWMDVAYDQINEALKKVEAL